MTNPDKKDFDLGTDWLPVSWRYTSVLRWTPGGNRNDDPANPWPWPPGWGWGPNAPQEPDYVIELTDDNRYRVGYLCWGGMWDGDAEDTRTYDSFDEAVADLKARVLLYLEDESNE